MSKIKKIILLILLGVCSIYITRAQVCELSSTTTRDYVEVLGATIFQGKTVEVAVGVHSEKDSYVDVDIEVTYINSKGKKRKEKYYGHATAKPNTITVIKKIKIRSFSGYEPMSVEVLEIKGR